MLKRLLVNSPFFILSGLLLAGLFLGADDFPSQPLCLYKHLFHFDCPGCGLKTAFLAIPKGNFAEAIKANWASIPLYLLFTDLWLIFVMSKLNVKPAWVLNLRRIAVMMSFIVMGLILTHWFVKLYHFFNNQDLSLYLESLLHGVWY